MPDEKDTRKALLLGFTQLQEEFETLKLVVKYQTFDLEATRRERDALKERLNKYEM